MKNLLIKVLIFFYFFISCVSMKNLYSEKLSMSSETNEYQIKILVLKTKNAKICSQTKIFFKNLSIEPKNEFLITINNNKINIDNNIISSNIVEVFSENKIIEINKKKYRGNILISIENGKLVFINKLHLEEYLYGVLPAEISPLWPKEVLKAQAVAARSFALYNLLKTKNNLYNLSDCVFHQVYSGYDIERKETNSAIDETRGEVLIFNNEIVQAFFHSNSGGKTASSEEVWGGKIDYLKSVSDTFSIGEKNYKWKFKIKFKELDKIFQDNKIIIGNIYDIKILKRTESGRVGIIKLYGTKNNIEITGKDFRNYVGLDKIRSTNFSINQLNDIIEFDGFGWGHGVGMSQEGAKKMAELGKKYREILFFYYRNVTLKKIY